MTSFPGNQKGDGRLFSTTTFDRETDVGTFHREVRIYSDRLPSFVSVDQSF